MDEVRTCSFIYHSSFLMINEFACQRMWDNRICSDYAVNGKNIRSLRRRKKIVGCVEREARMKTV